MSDKVQAYKGVVATAIQPAGDALAAHKGAVATAIQPIGDDLAVLKAFVVVAIERPIKRRGGARFVCDT